MKFFVRKVSMAALMVAVLSGGIATPTVAAPIDDARAVAQFVLSGLRAGGGLGGLTPRERARLFSEGILAQLRERGLSIPLEDIAQVIYDEGRGLGITPRLAVEMTLGSADGTFTGEIRIIADDGRIITLVAGDDIITGVEDPLSP